MNGLALMCGSRAQAEDAVQEAMARAWERTERGQHIESPRAWVAAVAANQLRDGFRRLMAERRARRRLGWRGDAPPESDAGWTDPAFGAVERRSDVARALRGLPRRQREVAVLRYWLDLEVAEIASALGIPEGTAKSALHRARRSLAAALDVNDETIAGRGSPPDVPTAGRGSPPDVPTAGRGSPPAVQADEGTSDVRG